MDNGLRLTMILGPLSMVAEGKAWRAERSVIYSQITALACRWRRWYRIRRGRFPGNNMFRWCGWRNVEVYTQP